MRLLHCLALLCVLAACRHPRRHTTWQAYGGGSQNLHYSDLQQIDTANVAQLQPAWTFHTGDADTARFSQIQCNPIIIDSVMYVTSPTLRLYALHAATGRMLWVFNPDSLYRNSSVYHFILNNNRGVTYWTDGKGDQRIFFVASSFLHCLDARTGRLMAGFGDGGRLDLHEGLGRDVKDLFITATSPGIIYKDLYILGSRVDEGPAAAPGHIRAFDVRTGRQQWIFHTIPQPGEYGYDTWEDPAAYRHIGGANSWSGFSLDEERGLLFAPTGSASFDFYGGRRRGQNLFANCLLALDAATGRRVWHYQFVHHDVWDRDLPCPPALVTITRNGRRIDAVAQVTKQGMVWLLDRETGQPLHAVLEMPVDTVTALAGEKLWPTQPVSSFSKPFVRLQLTANDLNPYLPDSSRARLQKEWQGYRYGSLFIPPGRTTTVQLPGFDGGAEWGGPAVDPETGWLYVNANEMGWLVTIRDMQPETPKTETVMQAGLRLYNRHCAGCHGGDRKGSGNYPSLTNIGNTYTPADALQLINTGRRMMPSLRHIGEEEKKAIVAYLLGTKEAKENFKAPQQLADTFLNLPYGITGYYKFLGPDGLPAIAPPWGTLTAINLNTGEHVWKTTLGEYPQLAAKGIPPTGTENYGGSVVTAGGLLFIAAARDGKIRAFHKRTGQLLWEYALPAPGFATPAVYTVDGKQYLVIACGGGKLRTRSADAYVAFALPGR